MSITKFLEPIDKFAKLRQHTKHFLTKLGILVVRDLVFHLPRKYVAKIINPRFKTLQVDDYISTTVRIKSSTRSKSFTKLMGWNAYGEEIALIFFNEVPKFISIGSLKTIEGVVTKDSCGNIQIAHPTIVFNSTNEIEPQYPLTQGLHNKQIHSLILKALKQLPDIHGLHGINLKLELEKIHNPKSIEEANNAVKRLGRLELIIHQFIFGLWRNRIVSKYPIGQASDIQQSALSHLGFTLSESQERVIQEIEQDQMKDRPMLRMLQGDVGSGKTLVALLTMLNAVCSGYQTVFMAPTDILITQHFQFFQKALAGLSIGVEILTGKTPPKMKQKILDDIIDGKVQILLGTHAVFQDNVQFKNLGYIIIDEHHRFGVKQRLELIQKASSPDVLVMTATPIPRSLVLAMYGNIHVSKLETRNKATIITKATQMSRINDVADSLSRVINNNEKVYWICPLIDNEEEGVMYRYKYLSKIYPGKVLYLHGRMPPYEKETVMQQFKTTMSVLVSTTVIEVGIDIEDATVMIIEEAERFGLSQLHQLRGRVGRHKPHGACLLLYNMPLSQHSRKRLSIMTRSNDGFYISEQDLLLRGGGEMAGVKQSGEQKFFFANLSDLDNLDPLEDESYKQYSDLLTTLAPLFNKHETFLNAG